MYFACKPGELDEEILVDLSFAKFSLVSCNHLESNILQSRGIVEIPEDKKVAGPIYREAWAAALAGNVDEGKKKVAELRGELTELELPTNGIKAELVQVLMVCVK